MGGRDEKSDENEKIFFNHVNILYGYTMSRSLSFDEVGMRRGHPSLYLDKIEVILNTPKDSDISYFVESDSFYPIKIKKTKYSPLCPEKKISPRTEICDYMNTVTPAKYTPHEKLNCDWTEKKNYLCRYRL